MEATIMGLYKVLNRGTYGGYMRMPGCCDVLRLGFQALEGVWAILRLRARL